MDFWKVMEYVVDFGLPVGLAAWGWLLFRRGLFPLRKAWKRVCPKCRYDMRETKGLVCPECGYGATSERALLHGEKSRVKAMVGVVMMVPCVWVVVCMAVMVPEAWAVRKGRQAVNEVEQAAESAQMKALFEVEGERELWLENTQGVSRYVFFGIRMVGVWISGKNTMPSPFPFSGTMPANQWAWDWSDSDQLGSRLELRAPWLMSEGTYGRIGILSWAHFVAHQLFCPIVHYRRYRAPMVRINRLTFIGERRGGKAVGIVPPNATDAIERLPNIKAVVLRDLVFNDALVEALTRLQDMRVMTIQDCEVTHKQLARLAANPGLEIVAISLSRPLTSEDLVALSGWPKLREIKLGLPAYGVLDVSDDAMAQLISAPSVSMIEFRSLVKLDRFEKTLEALRKKTERVFSAEAVFLIQAGDYSDHANDMKVFVTTKMEDAQEVESRVAE